VTVPPEKPIPTGELAEALGVSRTAILEWQRTGKIKPAFLTPGKHARWLLSDVKEQLRNPPAADGSPTDN